MRHRRFVSRKNPLGQREKKVSKIISPLFENSLKTINNRKNNNRQYKIASHNLVRRNTADC